MSHPTMGAWIEIKSARDGYNSWMSHPTMGAWIEIFSLLGLMYLSLSHPTMGAWIEINSGKEDIVNALVAPHDGCVD